MNMVDESQQSISMANSPEDDISEILSSLQQIMEDIKANNSIYSVIELLREDYGDL